MAIPVLAAGENAEHSGTDHFQDAVLREVGVTGRPGSSKCLCEPDALVELVDGEQSGVAGQLAWPRVDYERGAEGPGLAARRLVYSSSVP
jgi:hypothetical protein